MATNSSDSQSSPFYLSPLLDSSSDSWSYYLYQYWLDECDPRIISYPLFGSGPEWITLIMGCYLIFVTIIGPRIMKNRKPMELRNLMLAYNIFMVVSNAYFFFLSLRWLRYGRLLFDFEFPSREDNSPETLLMINQFYYYLLTKFVDLLDTVFFILRKKNSQITFLHLYHHTMVPILGWWAGKLAPTVQPIGVFAVLNTLVHVLMYSYYALAAFGPKIQPLLWWKKYITMLQLTQFGLLITYGVFSAMFTSGWPKGLYWIGWMQNPLFFYLFFDFYRQSYKKRNIKKIS